jgi:hypothetical protein
MAVPITFPAAGPFALVRLVCPRCWFATEATVGPDGPVLVLDRCPCCRRPFAGLVPVAIIPWPGSATLTVIPATLHTCPPA